MSPRLQTIALICGAALLAAVLAAYPPGRYAFYPACPYRTLLGWRCPGCGMTRAFASLLRGDWRAAVQLNLFSIPLAWITASALLFQLHAGVRWNCWSTVPVRAIAAGTGLAMAASILIAVGGR